MTETKLDLITVNNFLVGLRKNVARSRVQVINKLTRQIEQLHKKKGTPEQKQKNDRKAGRFLQEIQFIKKSKKTEVAKFSLSNVEKSEDDDFINPEVMSTMEIEKRLRKRAMLRIANHPIVAKEVEKFRQNFPDWEKDLDKILLVLGQKSQKKKSREKRAKRKQQRQKKKEERLKAKKGDKNESEEKTSDANGGDESHDEARDENLDAVKENDIPENVDSEESDSGEEDDNEKEDREDGDSESDSDEEDSDDGKSIDSENSDVQGFAASLKSLLEKPAKKQTEEEENPETDEEESDSSDNHESENDAVQEEGEEEEEKVFVQSRKRDDRHKKENSRNEKSKPEHFSRIEGEVVIKPINLAASESEDESEEESELDGKSNTSKEVGKHNFKKDSFFLGGVSESEDEDDEEEDAEEKNTSHPYFSTNQPKNRRERREFERWMSGERGGKFKPRGNFGNRGGSAGRGRGEYPARGGKEPSFRGRGGRGPFSGGRGDSRFGGSEDRKNESQVENLHPSWAAKRKNQISIGQFEGKKIKFGEDDDDGKQFHGRDSGKQFHGREIESSSLHPSWVARKEQNKGIQAFQGKKTTFDDNSGNGRNNFGDRDRSQPRSSSLHPSWLARKDQAKGIPAFQGKKTTFDEGSQNNFLNLPPPPRAEKNNSSSTLHPSWAARKDQQKGIQAFQGKKVVFDDDE